MARALAAAIVVSLLAVSGAGGSGVQTPKRGGTVVIAAAPHTESACLNAFVGTCGASTLDHSLVLEGAFEVKPDATFRPNLVSRAEVVSKQPFTLRYHIREQARWSDGVQVTAKDFVFTHRTIRKLRAEQQAVDWTEVRSVRPLDAKTVRVVLRAPNPDWRFLFGRVLPRHALAGADFASLWKDEIDNPNTGQPIGSGAFLVKRFERGRQLTLVRNPRYWGPHPAYLARIVYRFIPPEDAAEALRQGEVDMIAGPAVLEAAAAEFRREPAPGIRALSIPSQAWEHFDIRMDEGGHPALRNRLVRQALAYGIDRVAIARAIGELSGAPDAALEPLDSVVYLADSAYYQPNWKGYRYRRALARRLLERAGCRRGEDGIYSCAGERLSLRFATASGVERRERTELAQAHLRRVGVEVRPVFARPATVFGTIIPSGDFDLALFAWIMGASTLGASGVFGCQDPNNYTGYCSRLVTRDIVQAARILYDQRRVRLLNRVDARLAKAVPAIPLFQNTSPFALRTTIRGVVPNGAGSLTWNAEDWWLER